MLWFSDCHCVSLGSWLSRPPFPNLQFRNEFGTYLIRVFWGPNEPNIKPLEQYLTQNQWVILRKCCFSYYYFILIQSALLSNSAVISDLQRIWKDYATQNRLLWMGTVFPHNAQLFFSYFPTQIYAIMGSIISSNDLSTLKQNNPFADSCEWKEIPSRWLYLTRELKYKPSESLSQLEGKAWGCQAWGSRSLLLISLMCTLWFLQLFFVFALSFWIQFHFIHT